MKHYDYIAFDLDGTLTDPEKGLIEGFVYAFNKLGIDYGERESLRRFIGPSLFDEWQIEFGFTPDEANRAIDLFREYYNIYGWWDNKPYDGIREMLAELKAAGKTLILATSKPEDTAIDIIKLFGFDGCFDLVSGAIYTEEVTREKKWDVLEFALTGLGIDKTPEARAACVMVGDRKYDAEGAAVCGVDSIGVTWGHGSHGEMLAAPFTHLADTPMELAEILLR